MLTRMFVRFHMDRFHTCQCSKLLLDPSPNHRERNHEVHYDLWKIHQTNRLGTIGRTDRSIHRPMKDRKIPSQLNLYRLHQSDMRL